MEKEENPRIEFESIIKGTDLGSLADIAEFTFDKILDYETFKDFPVIGSFVGLIKFANSMSKYFLSKKVYKFLYGIHEIPQNERVKMLDKINSSREYQSRVGEIILELLDKIDSDIKPEILGRLYYAVVKQKIDFKTFLKAANIVKNIFIYDLIDLKKLCNGKSVCGRVSNEILTSGIVTTDYVAIYEKSKSLELNDLDSEDSNFSPTTLTPIGDVIINMGMN